MNAPSIQIVQDPETLIVSSAPSIVQVNVSSEPAQVITAEVPATLTIQLHSVSDIATVTVQMPGTVGAPGLQGPPGLTVYVDPGNVEDPNSTTFRMMLKDTTDPATIVKTSLTDGGNF